MIRDKNNTLITKIHMYSNNIFALNIQYDSLSFLSALIKNNSWLWHHCFGHLTFNTSSLMGTKQIVRGMPNIDFQDQVCEGCALDKHHRNSFTVGKAWRVSNPLHVVHTDLCRPMNTTSLGRNCYFLTFIDDYRRKTWVYFLKEKSEVFSHFKVFKALAEKQSGYMMQALRPDHGSEYVSNEFEDVFEREWDYAPTHHKVHP